MDARADELIEGPRGRRMLWELACSGQPDLTAVAWGVVRDLDDSGGVAYGFSVGWGSDGRAGTRPADTAAEVASRLGGLAQSFPMPPNALADALAGSVESARAWQSPDGADVMLAEPAFDEPLRAIAQRVLRMPEADWLWHPLAPHQLATVFFSNLQPESVPARPDPASLTDQLTRWAHAARDDEARFANHAANYPRQELSGAWWSLPMYTGIWTSPALADGSPAALHFIEDSVGENHALVWQAAARAGARVLEITGPADWAELCRRHPFDVSESRRHTWRMATGRAGRWVLPDWPSVAAEWDAVHVTGAAYLRCAERAIEVDADAGTASLLAGWAPGAAVWLTDALEITGEPVDWRLRDDAWSRVG